MQVARTVAHGATNQETADALLMSVRTVESHLARALAGSGTTSRAELMRSLADPVPRNLP
ncbi:LuxR C-terminal-related transcriptional regulator [Streptomyces sp. NPDC056144]|uniref:LuxR C-terminal-related transcriptional regulator n=1 Tax=unclassified Streptomyces TaxID=2593676 RepID=UPI0035E194F8